MVRFPEAEARMFHNIFVCKDCKRKIKAPVMKVLQHKIKCRKCDSKALRTLRKK